MEQQLCDVFQQPQGREHIPITFESNVLNVI